jgi:hypothetical protein
MKTFLKALVVTAGSLAWFYGFVWLHGNSSFSSERTETALSLVILSVPLLLAYLGFRVLRMETRSISHKLVVLPSFAISLAPAVILLGLTLLLLLIPR